MHFFNDWVNNAFGSDSRLMALYGRVIVSVWTFRFPKLMILFFPPSFLVVLSACHFRSTRKKKILELELELERMRREKNTLLTMTSGSRVTESNWHDEDLDDTNALYFFLSQVCV